ncbi:hypothetical protein OBBRIDRAFT_631238 [Obba rivulosa]|uniref:Uncharacterized protein n=1 Tax=Obba rivulosa TaxID=1052685 RepID=A0A8E2AXA8_9APHY|nr:hypothetical protein OBBRIDRAFT_631238 [Obba rivulosa]
MCSPLGRWRCSASHRGEGNILRALGVLGIIAETCGPGDIMSAFARAYFSAVSYALEHAGIVRSVPSRTRADSALREGRLPVRLQLQDVATARGSVYIDRGWVHRPCTQRNISSIGVPFLTCVTTLVHYSPLFRRLGRHGHEQRAVVGSPSPRVSPTSRRTSCVKSSVSRRRQAARSIQALLR